MTKIYELEPREVFEKFYQLNQIPRGSGNERQVSDWLVSFAKERGLEVEQDDAMNVIIRKPASPGYESAPGVIIQGHMDMVCEKTTDSKHDFLTDPIEMYVDGDMLRANGTTLGGDDGIAVAYGLAVLDSDLPHPALEVLITTNEEVGMDGAMAIKPGQVQGKRLLNIDSEEEGIFLSSCAGGIEVEIEFPYSAEPLGIETRMLTIEVSGLTGGHSGMQIGLGRANAIKVLARILQAAKTAFPELRLAEFNGGSKHNAIPSAARASVIAPSNPALLQKLIELSETIKREYQHSDPDMTIHFGDDELLSAYNIEDSARIIDFLCVVPHGVKSMSHSIEGLVESSLNAAIFGEGEDLHFHFISSIRSSVYSRRRAIEEELEILAHTFGARYIASDGYPAWEYEEHSPLRDTCLRVWKEVTGQDPEVTAVHAGLECGLLKEVMPDVDMISFGPNLYDVHTPAEHLSISSAAKLWDYLKALLAALR
ncbi:MAG: aminoacyl-histidine dipeptidase [Eubacteriales bacterium]|nr:aminoacyl-histidine dipeptidase [Eubacteriales bacterium]